MHVTVEYKIKDGACVPLCVHTIVISMQHNPEISLEDQRTRLLEDVVKVRPRMMANLGLVGILVEWCVSRAEKLHVDISQFSCKYR